MEPNQPITSPQPPAVPVPSAKPTSIVMPQLAGIAVICAFALYTLGFIIWRAHLLRYGVSSIPFLQTEYVAAALSYVFFVSCVAIPPAIIFEYYRLKLEGQSPDMSSVDIVVGMWFSLLVYFRIAYYPDSNVSRWFTAVLILSLTFLGLHATCSIWFKESKLFKYVKVTPMKFTVATMVMAMTYLAGLGIDIAFLFLTFLIYPIYLSLYTVKNLPPHVLWKKGTMPVKLVMGTMLVLLLLTHAGNYGVLAFGTISRRAGGGKPESAFLQISEQHTNLLSSLNLPITNSLIGPVAVLLQSDRELIILDYSELNGPAKIQKIVTNTTITTSTLQATNLSGLVQTKFATNIVSRYTTNFVTNTNRYGKARQIRSDVVDAVIYSD